MKEVLKAKGATVIGDANPPPSDMPPEGQIQHLADLVGAPTRIPTSSLSVCGIMSRCDTSSRARSMAKKVGGWVGWFESGGGPHLPNQDVFLPMCDRRTIDGGECERSVPTHHADHGGEGPGATKCGTECAPAAREVRGREVACLRVYDFIKDSMDDGTKFAGRPAYVWSDHLFRVTSVDDLGELRSWRLSLRYRSQHQC
jgi:hypothetical protein